MATPIEVQRKHVPVRALEKSHQLTNRRSQVRWLGHSCPSALRVLLVHAHHDARHLGAAHDGGEDRARRVVAREAGLAHAAAVVHHQRGNLTLKFMGFSSYTVTEPAGG